MRISIMTPLLLGSPVQVPGHPSSQIPTGNTDNMINPGGGPSSKNQWQKTDKCIILHTAIPEKRTSKENPGTQTIATETIGTTGKQNSVPSELGQPQSSQSGPGLATQTALTIEITTPPNISIQPTLVISPL